MELAVASLPYVAALEGDIRGGAIEPADERHFRTMERAARRLSAELGGESLIELIQGAATDGEKRPLAPWGKGKRPTAEEPARGSPPSTE